MLWQCRALGWLDVDLYLTGRQPAQSAPAKAPPSPMSTSSAKSDSGRPQRYARFGLSGLWLSWDLAYNLSRPWLPCSPLPVVCSFAGRVLRAPEEGCPRPGTLRKRLGSQFLQPLCKLWLGPERPSRQILQMRRSSFPSCHLGNLHRASLHCCRSAATATTLSYTQVHVRELRIGVLNAP